MGFYLNPEQCKEDWLYENGVRVSLDTCADLYLNNRTLPDELIVCLIHNPAFSAALVCVNRREFLRSLPRGDDHRPRDYFAVKIAKLSEVMPATIYTKLPDYYRDNKEH